MEPLKPQHSQKIIEHLQAPRLDHGQALKGHEVAPHAKKDWPGFWGLFGLTSRLGLRAEVSRVLGLRVEGLGLFGFS